MRFITAIFIIAFILNSGCTNSSKKVTASEYFKNTDTALVKTGGIKMISINTPKGKFNVWTKRFGNNPTIKVLLLHGGPGSTHEYFESFESFFPQEEIEFIYYDQLGSY